jgi:hypothetical protein
LAKVFLFVSVVETFLQKPIELRNHLTQLNASKGCRELIGIRAYGYTTEQYLWTDGLSWVLPLPESRICGGLDFSSTPPPVITKCNCTMCHKSGTLQLAPLPGSFYTEDSHLSHAAGPESGTDESHEALRELENMPISSAVFSALIDTQVFLPFDDFTLESPTQRLDRSFQAPFSQISSISTGISPATTGFLYANHIRLQDVTFLAATLANAASIGVSRDDYFQDKPSPFLATAQREPRSHTSRNFEHIKPHLRPLDIQLSRPHASYLDLIIFPHFRERAMLHGTSDPCLLDQEALFTDMISGGLTCWGSLACGSERGCGVPWDMRSWEAKPWFLKKWWFLVGRKDEDMWETSIWWWQLRGVEPEYELP